MESLPATSESWLVQTLEKQSTTAYYIEREDFKTNHMAHGIIAIYRLGASRDRVNKFIDWYTDHVEAPDHPRHSDEHVDAKPASDEELRELLGQRKSYYKIRNRFDMKFKQYGSVEDFIREEFPKLSRGLVCSALHGLIHTGYGYSAGSTTTVIEGLAYLHHSYKPLCFDEEKPENDISHFGKGNKDILDVISEFREDISLRNFMLEGEAALRKSDWHSGRFQYRVAALMKAGDALLKYIYKIKFPSVQQDEDRSLPVAISDWLLDQAIAVYAMSEHVNDFFLIHGVTSAWSLRQIIPLLKYPDALDTLRTFTCVLLSAYMARNCPALTKKLEVSQSPIEDSTWMEIIGKPLSSDLDEHIYKLVQVCYDRWRENKDSENADLYLQSANLCVSNEMTF